MVQAISQVFVREQFMKQPKILVTGATGKTGAAVVAELRENNVPVRALVRSRDARSERLARLGAEVLVADMFDPEQLLAAMCGTERAYYLPPFHPYMIQSATAFVLAAKEAKLESIVQMSQWLSSPSHPSLATRQIWLIDQFFSMIPSVVHTIINPGFFADNYLRLIGFAAHLGLFPALTGDSKNAPPSNEDMARVAVAALLDPAKHAGKAYRPTGPELLSANEMVEILSKVLGRKVRRFDLPFWMFVRTARIQGVSPFLLSGLRYYIEDHKQGAFEIGAPTNDVLEVTGRQPEDFETIARRYAALPEAQQNFKNWLHTFLEFMQVPMRLGYNLDKFDREQGFPFPPTPQFAMKSESWKATHDFPEKDVARGYDVIPTSKATDSFRASGSLK
jgi:NAD(P)H dehydrogenase (quinone)